MFHFLNVKYSVSKCKSIKACEFLNKMKKWESFKHSISIVLTLYNVIDVQSLFYKHNVFGDFLRKYVAFLKLNIFLF